MDTPRREQALPTATAHPGPAEPAEAADHHHWWDGEAQPDRMLLDQIAAGVLDMHLAPISDAIHARRELLHTISSAKALTMLNVGDRLRINHHARPRDLHGVHVARARGP